MVARCIPHQARAHSSGEAEYSAAVSATSEAMLIREVLLFMGLEVRIELLLTARLHVYLQTRRSGNNTPFVNESSLATAVGEARNCHGECVHIRRKPCRPGDKVTTYPQAATAEAVERSGVKWNRDFGKW